MKDAAAEDGRRFGRTIRDVVVLSALPAVRAAAAATSASSGLRVLLAEDNAFNQEILRHLLAGHGHVVTTAGDGLQAIRMLEREAFDVMLLDCHMPEADGFEVVAALRERERRSGGWAHLPIIGLTTLSTRGDGERCLAAGMDDYLAKPVTSRDLFAAIGRAVGRRAPAAAPAPAPQEPDMLIDSQTLWNACGGDPVLLGKLVEAYRLNVPRQLAEIEAAVGREDAPALRSAAHKLHGLVSTFSAVVARAVRVLEQAAADGQLQRAPTELQTITDLTGRLASALSRVTISDLESS